MKLQKIQEPVKNLLEETDTFLEKALESNIDIVNEIIDISPIAKGKKIRSTLLFLLAGLDNNISPDLPRLAASIEMLHLSSLIHDDVVDHSERRRGEETVNVNFGNFISVLWGDFLFINSIDNFSKVEKKYTDIIIKAARAMVEGQMLEVENTANFDIRLNIYYDIVKKKTSSLFAGVAEIASVLNGAPTEAQKAYYDFGLDFGTMFQVSDDVLDIFSENSGKDRFRDLKEGKITLPVILLLKENKQALKENFPGVKRPKNAAGAGREKLRGYYSLFFSLKDKILTDRNIERILGLFKDNHIEQLSRQKVKEYYDRCTAFLDGYPPSVYKESLSGLLDFVKNRDY
ncbi:MAG: polyprenyl synthetase family protein [Candidatus Aminicenantes bacterium]|nr:polyprenyl synthetase family protein [Candidatus Aminicenantes bacterium]